MAALEAAAVKAIADEAAKLAAEAAAGEIEQLIAVKLAELATPEGFRALALKAAAGEAGSLATKTVKKKVKSDIKKKTGLSLDPEMNLSPAEKILIKCYREADLPIKKQVIDLLKDYVDREDLLGFLLSDSEPDIKEELKTAKEYIEEALK